MVSSEVREMFAQVKENLSKLRGCARHEFEGGAVRLGQKMTCKQCGGVMGLAAIGEYIAGYKAAGKPADDIWPGYEGIKRENAS